MRIAVIGAGAVGGAMAALLHRGGHEIEVTARGAHLDAIRESGIRLGGAWGSHVAPVAAGEVLTVAPELVIVTTKAQDAAAAITANLSVIGEAPILVVQNGLDGIAIARLAAPLSPVVGGLAMFAASFLSPGEVTITTANPTFLGGDDAAVVKAVAKVLGAVMPVTRVDDFAGAQWTKLVVNQINALPAVTGLSVQDTIAHRGLRRVLTTSMRESVDVANALGVRFASLGGLGRARLGLFSALPIGAAEALPRLMRRRMGTTPNPGSTLQSLRRGQPTEVDYLNGAVVAAGLRAGVPTPVNALIVRLVHEVEASKAFLVPEVVVARVATASE
ncbi:2-dehydropantoate 2-reductase [Conyzicola lurida]|uniref:2-dehydropantoate 2-reductase n=1 Tax=Conyzicola lurida TaxID=1172621 RepID=A0A841AMS4_9MICO|nr:2-dehydropantoate 2-reductase [Conyzicola lurida]MBB5842729.1 2-dehydropantoate 2-reductase [Conyzicola lurida]